MKVTEEQRHKIEAAAFHANLTSLKTPDMHALALAVKVDHTQHTRATLIVAIMHKAGYKLPSKQEQIEAKKPIVYSPEQIRQMAKQYIQDETALLSTCMSMLKTLMDLFDDNPTTHLEEVIGELNYYRNHSNLARLSTLKQVLK